jgi:MarR family transcriptional regulator, organic hydroperoxide resistance regulator
MGDRTDHHPLPTLTEALAWPGFALWRAAMQWRRIVDARLAPLGLTHAQLLTLLALTAEIEHSGDAVPQRAVAQRAGLDPMTTSQLLRKLEVRSLVDRGPHGTDARRWRVLVTPRGQRLLRSALRVLAPIGAAAGPQSAEPDR